MIYAQELLQHHIKSMARSNNRILRRKEKKMQLAIDKEFEVQKKIVLNNYKKLLNKKSYKSLEDDIDEGFEKINNDDLTNVIITASAGTLEFGAEYRIKKMKLGEFNISFDLDHPLAVEYLQSTRPLVLAKMGDTTKELIKPILQEGVKNGTSYTEIAKQIEENFGFSRTRSLMIATNETGHAYEYGNMIPMKDLQAQGEKVEKQWSTVGDEKVTLECSENEEKGWISIDDLFPSGDYESPRNGNPNCRCTTLWKIL